MAKPNADLAQIVSRNRLRQEAQLPLLSIETEMRRVRAAREQAEFEREFERRIPELCHLWRGNNDGWIANMGRYSMARNRVRQEMRKRRDGVGAV
jgi:hypothetical protein